MHPSQKSLSEASCRPFHQWTSAILRGASWAEPPNHAEGFAFLSWLEHHRLGPVIAAALPESHPFRHHFNRQIAQAWGQYENRMKWLAQLCDPQHAIEWVFFKGLGSAHNTRIFEHASQRILGDVDVLVPDHQLPKAIQVATQLGFQSFGMNRQQTLSITHKGYNHQMVHADYGVLEIHFRLWGDIPMAMVSESFNRAKPIHLETFSASTVTSSDLLIMMSTHLWLSTGQIRWIWLYELWRLAANFAKSDWDHCLQITRRHGLQAFLLGGLLAWQRLWHLPMTPLLTSVCNQLRAMLSPFEKSGLKLAYHPSRDRLRGMPLIMGRRFSFRPTRDGWLGLGRFRAKVHHPTQEL